MPGSDTRVVYWRLSLSRNLKKFDISGGKGHLKRIFPGIPGIFPAVGKPEGCKII